MMSETNKQLERIASLIESHRFHFEDEAQLQAGIEGILRGASVEFVRECRLGQGDRVDFLVTQPECADIALEVKLATSLVAISRQLWRYSQFLSVGALILVTTRQRHRMLPAEMNGKPLRVIALEVAF